MRIERITRKGRTFAVIPLAALQKLMSDAETLALPITRNWRQTIMEGSARTLTT